jgi:hypothetical protein
VMAGALLPCWQHAGAGGCGGGRRERDQPDYRASTGPMPCSLWPVRSASAHHHSARVDAGASQAQGIADHRCRAQAHR